MSDWPERTNRASVYKILQYLLDRDILKVIRIEGLAEHFEALETIIEESKREEKEKFIKYLEYLDSIYEFDDKEILKRTIQELK